MLILFIVIFILSSQLIFLINTDKNSGFVPYPFGTTIIGVFFHLILLVMSIYYMGWICGIILFLCHFFAVIHATVGWILNIPKLIIISKNDYNKTLRCMMTNLYLMIPMLFVAIIFTIVSFFVTDFKSMLVFLQNNTSILIYASVVVAVLGIARIFVNRKINKN